MEILYKSGDSRFVHGDNLEVMKKFKPNSVDSCISDFPYDLSFMGKKWDTTGNFYEWCLERARGLLPIIKPGGYVCIFGHPKTNHRMKCAFEDAGFNIVEEIEWIYGTGFPKNQDIGKLFDKAAGVEREIVGKRVHPTLKNNPSVKSRAFHAETLNSDQNMESWDLTAPSTELAKKWDGWKTAGLKPAHEPITIFQKPLEGTYVQNIEKYEVGGMNIDACRIVTSQEDKDTINAKASKNPTNNYADSETRKYGKFAQDVATPANELGRFPSNIILEETIAYIMDNQSGETQSGKGNGNAKVGETSNGVTPLRRGNLISRDDSGGASRYFLNIEVEPPFYYCAKPTKKEKGVGNVHVTVKPKELIKWIIKLITPRGGKTIDITAGSGTHALACEELNKEEGYELNWIDVELMNTEDEPYCDIAIDRLKNLQGQC